MNSLASRSVTRVSRQAGVLSLRGNSRAALRRRELLWAWLTALVLLICWDAATRLDQTVSAPRPRLSHVTEADERIKACQSERIDTGERATHSELMDGLGAFIGNDAFQIQCMPDG